MTIRSHLDRLKPLPPIVVPVAVVLLVAGLTASRQRVPEWRADPTMNSALFLKTFRDVASRAGIKLEGDEPRLDLIYFPRDNPSLYRLLKERSADWLVDNGRAVMVELSQAYRTERPDVLTFFLDVDLHGHPWWLLLHRGNFRSEQSDTLRFARLLTEPGESLQPLLEGLELGGTYGIFTVVDCKPPQYVYVLASGLQVWGFRAVGTEADARAMVTFLYDNFLSNFMPLLTVLLGSTLLVLIRAAQRRPVFWKGGAAGAVMMIFLSLPDGATRLRNILDILSFTLGVGFLVVLIFCLSILAESTYREGFYWSWINLPGLGRESYNGFWIGVGLAGVVMLFCAASVSFAGLHASHSLVLSNPNYSPNQFSQGVLWVALLAFTVVLCRSRGWDLKVQAIIGTLLVFHFIPWWGPRWFLLLATLPIVFLLVWTLSRKGLFCCLVSVWTASYLPVFVFSALHLDWKLGWFFASGGICAGFLLFGMWGLFSSVRPTDVVKIFVAYAHDDREHMQSLDVSLKPYERRGEIELWADRKITTGKNWRAMIVKKLQEAKVIVLLVSPHFLASQFCVCVEMQRALDKEGKGTARVVPVIVAACNWQDEEGLNELQAVPADGRTVADYGTTAEAWTSISQEIMSIARVVRDETDE